jgi:hypothetical protein
MNKKLIYGVVIAVVVVIAGIWYMKAYPAFDGAKGRFVDQKNNNAFVTSDWKTYTSKEYGFSFQYPAGYGNFEPSDRVSDATLLAERAKGVEKFIVNNGNTQIQATYPELVVIVHPLDKYAFRDAPGGTSTKYDSANKKCIDFETYKPQIVNKSTEPVKINNNTIACHVSTGDAGFSYGAYIIPDERNNRMIEIGFASDSEGANYAPLDENIIYKSFKFID